MRIFIILALLLPMTTVQFYSTDSHALNSKTVHQEILFDNKGLTRRQVSNSDDVDEILYSNNNAMIQVENEQSKINIDPPVKTKRVSLVQGKRNSQGMQLLSVLLLLKDKSK